MQVNVDKNKKSLSQFPEDWRFAPLGSMITEFRGGAPLRPSDFTSSGVKVLPKGGVGRTGWLRIEDADLQYCSVEYAKKHHRNQVDETFTIVVLRDLVPSGPSIGLIVQIKSPEYFVLAQGVYGFNVNSEVEPAYLVHLSNTRWYRHLANSIMVGSTQVHITNTAFKQAEIPLPPLEEQRAIATALSDVDALIASLDKLIAKKRAIKTAAMQQLLTGKKRLPGFSGDWEVSTLGEISVFENGDRGRNYPSPGSFVQSGIPFINAGHIADGKINLDGMNYITTESFNRLGNGKVRAGDILFCLRGSLGKFGIVIDGFGDGAIASSLVIIRPKTTVVIREFLSCYFSSGLCEQMIETWSGGAAQPNLGAQDLARFSIAMPPTKAEQKTIATILSDMDTEIIALEARREKTKAIKQGMMQELLTGRTRLI